jgi:hypothetical protein
MAKLHIKQEGKLASKVLDKLPDVEEDDSPDMPSRTLSTLLGPIQWLMWQGSMSANRATDRAT